MPDRAQAVLEYLRSLTEIRPHAGWRNSGSTGESEALDYVADVLGGFSNLQAWGLELERQSFPVFVATEPREAILYLTLDGQEAAVAADLPAATVSISPRPCASTPTVWPTTQTPIRWKRPAAPC